MLARIRYFEWIRFVIFLLSAVSFAATAEGERQYQERCASCHGADAEGGERGPAIASRLSMRTDTELRELIRNGIPGAGMPATRLPPAELVSILAHLRTLYLRGAPVERIENPIRGIIRNKSAYEMQVQGDDGRLHLFRNSEGKLREVTSGRDWPAYHGDPSGNRHSPLAQITPQNVRNLRTEWIYNIAGAQRLQVTPVVVGGIMYVTTANQVHALDAGTGRRIWMYSRPRTKGLAGDAAGGINRGVAIHGERLFFATDHAHLLALNRHTGALLWETEMADYRLNYGATAAPLVAGEMVISGISGGDEGVRGFLAGYKISTGERVWRFWTVPTPRDALASTWQGKALEHGCATTWMTGTFDPQLDLLYWGTGNPCPDYNGDERRGDNLYSDSVLALHPATGELAWYFQYTPHDLHDWDAQQTPMLIDAEYKGRARKLLAQANRNGFFYVLDRTTGEFLNATPFVKKLTWASRIGPDGRPVINPGAVPTPEGIRACPAVEGATNWFSTAFNPDSGFFFVQALEKCNIFKKTPGTWEAGKSYYDGSTKEIPGEPGRKVLRALNLPTGRVVWEREQTGSAKSWGGVLSTASGLLFVCEDGGYFTALDAKTGRLLWRFPANELWKASPMTYEFDGRQFVAVAAGGNILAFSLPE